MDGLLRDLRLSLRSLSHRPAYAGVAVAVLAVGLAAGSTLFTYVNALFVPFPGVTAPERLVEVGQVSEEEAFGGLSYPDFLDLEGGGEAFEGLAAGSIFAGSLRGPDGARWVSGRIVSGGFFRVLGVGLAAGRGIGPGDDRTGSPAVAVLSDRLWRQRFAADPEVVGSTVHLNGRPFAVVGVAAPEFRGTISGFYPDLWVPLSQAPAVWLRQPAALEDRETRVLGAIGRLAPGVTTAQAEAALERLAAGLDELHPRPGEARRFRVEPATWAHPQARAGVLPAARLLSGAVILLLLLASANAANLLLSRARGRRREMAIRAALGAGRRRLVRQLLVENLLLALAAGALGLALAGPASHRLAAYFAPPSVMAFGEAPVLPFDHRVFAFALVASLAAGLLAGLWPALTVAGRRDLTGPLKAGGGAGSGRRGVSGPNLLVAVQAALAVVLLIAAGLVFRTLRHLEAVDPGFETAGLLVANVSIASKELPPEEGRRFFEDLVRRIAAEPGVQAAGLAHDAPLSGFSRSARVVVGGEAEAVTVATAAVGPGYFQTLGLRPLRGRDLGPGDREGAPGAVVVNRALVRRLFAGRDPLGRRLSLAADAAGEAGPDFEIVGVVADVPTADLSQEPGPQVYFSYLQHGYGPRNALLVRTAADPMALVPGLRRELAAADPDLALVGVLPLEEHLEGTFSTRRMNSDLFSAFALCGLAMATAGVFSVLSLAVGRRRREIGVRMALGARPGDVVRMVVRQGMVWVGLGLAVGVAAALGAVRLVESLLYGVEPLDPATFLAGAGLLAAAALAACYLPARRASRVDPRDSLVAD